MPMTIQIMAQKPVKSTFLTLNVSHLLAKICKNKKPAKIAGFLCLFFCSNFKKKGKIEALSYCFSCTSLL